MKKIQPNDPCLCGSGIKYKKCCGANSINMNKNDDKTDLFLDDFVIEKLNEDCMYLENALQMYLGPDGFEEFTNNSDMYCEKKENHILSDWVHSELYEGIRNVAFEGKEGPLYIRPYDGDIPEKQGDIMSLCKDNLICKKGCQVEIFHAVLMENLIRRFDDYYYKPSKKVAKYQSFGAFAHRGYDFLLGITLYLELQLGVHVYFDIEKTSGYLSQEDFSEINAEMDQEIKHQMSENKVLFDHIGLRVLMNDYISIIETIAKEYDPFAEVELYKILGAYHSEEEYKGRREIIEPGFLKRKTNICDFDYIEYLKNLVIGICYNDDHLVLSAQNFPQCDMAKYLMGLENLCAVFGDYKAENITDIEQYHSAVFNFMDELNGMSSCFLLHPYKDSLPMKEDEYNDRLCNPARKSISPFPVRWLRMRVFNVFNGKAFTLKYRQGEGEWKTIGKYPILPWICNEEIEMFHTNPFDGEKREIEDLFSDDILRRQDFLNMEYRIGKKPPVNRIEEYLDPEIYYDWVNSKELKKIKIETEELREECNHLRDTMGAMEEEFKYEYEEKVQELVSKYEEKAEEIRISSERVAFSANYKKIKKDVDSSLLQYEEDIKSILGIEESLLFKLDDRKQKKLSYELKKQLYTSELTYHLLDEATEKGEPIDVTISVLPLTKSIELVLKKLFSHIPLEALEDFSESKFKDPSEARKIFFNDVKPDVKPQKKEQIEMWALTQLFNDQILCGKWDQWWNSNSEYVDLSLLRKLSGIITLPQLEDKKYKSSDPASFQPSDKENIKILYQALNYIRDRYRNPIAHSTRLKKDDYVNCRDILISGQKLFWILLAIIK